MTEYEKQLQRNTNNRGYRRFPSRWSNSRRDALRANHVWEITLEEHKKLIAQGCHYCGKNLEGNTGANLDRIDNNKGYTPDNVLPCCGECNRIRSNKYTVAQMRVIGNALKKL